MLTTKWSTSSKPFWGGKGVEGIFNFSCQSSESQTEARQIQNRSVSDPLTEIIRVVKPTDQISVKALEKVSILNI